MVRVCFCSRGKPELVFILGSFDAVKYAGIQTHKFLQFTDSTHKVVSRFQQDNAASHTAKHIGEFFYGEKRQRFRLASKVCVH